MCGIAGIVGNNSNEAKELIWSLKHRGPDDSGSWSDLDVLLVATRLMITSDKEEGAQPFVKDDHVLVFNGEIFNYGSLRKSLEKDYRFQTNTDTEVLMLGLIAEGESFINRLDGQFAFAFYDIKKKSILLARDHAGRMPLHYTDSKDGRFIFASEIKGILSVGVKAEIKEGDGDFRYQWSNEIPLTNETVFKGIYQLLPGHLLRLDVKKQTRKIRKYYQITQPRIEYRPESYFLSRLSDLLERSVSRELTGHARIGLSYSGGIDSTIILKLLKDKLNYTPISIAAFQDEKYFDTVREACRIFDTKLVEIALDKRIIKELPKTINAIESYGMGHGIELLHFNISKEAKNQGIKVLMCGAGLDEEFLGYRHFLEPIFNQYNGKQLEKQLIKERHTEIRQLYNSHLSVRDRTRMAHGIEARVPFVNVPIIEFAARIPPSYCVGKTGEVKKIMRKSSLKFLPREYAYMKKIQSYTHSNIFSIIREELDINTNEEYLTICREILRKIFIDGKNANSITV